MGLFDDIQGNLDAIAGKVGMSPDQVKSLTDTLQSELANAGSDKLTALKATAEQHGVSVDKIQELLNHGGVNLSDLGGVGGLVGNLFKKD